MNFFEVLPLQSKAKKTSLASEKRLIGEKTKELLRRLGMILTISVLVNFISLKDVE